LQAVDNGQIALKLVMDELDIRLDTTSVHGRKTVQKAVYLAQAAGVDLGYRYNWYIFGPYSPLLTHDSYALSESLASDDDPSGHYELQKSARTRLQHIKPLMTPPAGTGLTKPEWLELIASIHYLRDARHMEWDEVKRYLDEKDRGVATFARHAHDLLQEREMIGVATGR
jgi:hypothetical protein